ncbi:MAG: cardiolipin synthase [Lachnospiraceae bacterium]|nr:cardiolipin synthase [Lachnospiraceae bacterium]
MDIIHIWDEGFVKKYLSGFIRAWTVAALLLLQFAFVFVLAFFLSRYGLYVYLGVEFLLILIVCSLVNKRTDESFKIGWLIIISVLPIAGALMYLIWGRSSAFRKIRKRHTRLIDAIKLQMGKESETLDSFSKLSPEYEGIGNLLASEGYPIFKNNILTYHPSGEMAFAEVLIDIEKAKEFIFLSFFIVAEGALWESIKPIIIKKAHEGVRVRFLYDDFGSMFRTDKRFWRELTDEGIEVAAFNPVHKYLDKLYKNFRSHQKIIVIDGTIGYTGGFNLADEYVNALSRFGHWKDNGIRIEGDAVWGLSALFLEMWGITTGAPDEDISVFKRSSGISNDVYCIPFADGPDNIESTPVPSAIRQLIYSAKKYLYITTPYLVVGDEIMNALIDAKKRGVDVRIITPAIPDKKFVFALTRLSYGRLLSVGIRIYEYTPGFIHAKGYITDGFGLLGTVNLDYRSLYLHYECEVAIWDNDTIEQVKRDIEGTFEASREISFEEWKNRPVFEKIKQKFLSLFSSLL